MKIFGPVTAQVIDSSGELLHLAGLAVDDFINGTLYLNYEHGNEHAEDTIGKFIYAKKIFKQEDCSDDKQLATWNQIHAPFLFGVAELFSDQEDGHVGAICCSAMLRYLRKRNEPIRIGFSVEGQTLKRADGDLLKTCWRKTAFTLRPCNKACLINVLDDSEQDLYKHEIENFHGVFVDLAANLFDDSASEGDSVQQLKKALADLNKTLTASGYNTAPGNLTGGSALQVEDRNLRQKIHDVGFRDQRNKIKSAYRDWDRRRPFKEVLKASMPEISDDFIDHFDQVMDELSLKKSANSADKLIRISADHSGNKHDDENQKRLLEGLYWNMAEPYAPEHGSYTSDMKTLQNDAGEKVFSKYLPQDFESGEHDTSTKYYHLANDLYGLGDHVPTTTHFSHPNIHNGEPVHVSEFIQGSTTPLESRQAWLKAAQKARENGSMHKLALMDLINGASDRHLGNILIHPKGHLLNIDNDNGLNQIGFEPMAYTQAIGDFQGIGNDTLHPEAKAWLERLGSKALLLKTHQYGVPIDQRKAMATRLELLRRASDAGQSFNRMIDNMKHLGLMR